MSTLLQEFVHLSPDELPNELPPMKNAQHYIDFVPRSSLLNLPHYKIRPLEQHILQETGRFITKAPHTERSQSWTNYKVPGHSQGWVSRVDIIR